MVLLGAIALAGLVVAVYAASLFDDLPEAIDNAAELARRLNLEIRLGQPSLPAYPVPAGRTTEDHLREEAGAGLERRLAGAPPVQGPARA